MKQKVTMTSKHVIMMIEMNECFSLLVKLVLLLQFKTKTFLKKGYWNTAENKIQILD